MPESAREMAERMAGGEIRVHEFARSLAFGLLLAADSDVRSEVAESFASALPGSLHGLLRCLMTFGSAFLAGVRRPAMLLGIRPAFHVLSGILARTYSDVTSHIHIVGNTVDRKGKR